MSNNSTKPATTTSEPTKANEWVRTLTLEKETPNKVKYAEVAVPNQPPLLDSVYIPKWIAGKSRAIEVTVRFL